MRSIFKQFEFGACALCRHPAGVQTGLCAACHAALPVIPGPLCRCGLPCPGAAPADPPPLCGRCLHRPPAFTRVCCAHAYDFPLDRLLNRYKHHRQLSVERVLGLLWEAALPFPGAFTAPASDAFSAPVPRPLPDALVPIPSHWRRLWWRGFNPAWRLAQLAGDHLGRPVLPAVRRARSAPRQQGLAARVRALNLQGALEVCQPVDGLALALIDDVVTTGSTAREASQCLLAAGAASVEVWALARTLPWRQR